MSVSTLALPLDHPRALPRRPRTVANGARAERLAALFSALPAAVVVLDGRGQVSEANPAAMALLGGALEGRLWRDVVAELFRPDTPGGDLVLRDGRMVTLLTRPLGDEPGQVLLLQDVTEARQLESRLNHSRRLADMGRMAATLAHQVRTPLASALLYVSQLHRPVLPEPKRIEFAEKARACLRDLERLITDMLAYARGEAGQGERHRAADLARAALDQSREMLAEREIEVSLDDDAAGIEVRVNAPLVLTALQNLIDNAAQAVGPRGRIVLAVVPAAPAAVDLVVADQGPGIAPERLSRLFEPFASGRPGGTGLGLAVVRTVARAHGGEAWVDSAPGKGSRFGIRLPVMPSSESEHGGGH